MLNQVYQIYTHLQSGNLDVVRTCERKNLPISPETEQRVLDSIIGGMTQKAAAQEHSVSEYTAFRVHRDYKRMKKNEAEGK